jgi:ribose transport system ATP-binding protein
LQEALTFNVNLPSWSYMRRRPWLPLVDHHRAHAQAMAAVGALSIKTRSVKTPVAQLSGGNQQKVVIGKWLARRARLVILDEPTRGVDVGARQEIYKIVRQLAGEGRAVIVISSELQEMIICDRVLVVVEGQVVGEIAGGEITEESILHMCYTNQPSRSAS